jgi:putative transposase
VFTEGPSSGRSHHTPSGTRRASRTASGPPQTFIPGTNTIESLNVRFRRSVKARGHFRIEQAALKHLYLVIISLDLTGRGRQRWSNRWKAALNAFGITYTGRLSAGRK